MNKLSRIFNRSHQPDKEALSALADGELDAGSARTLGAHVAACDACQTELGGMRQVRSMLQALPEQEAPRSFRLREADLSPAPRYAPQPWGLMRVMPALSAAAAFVFVVALSADLTSGGGNGNSSVTTFGERSAMESATDLASGGDRVMEDSAAAPAPADAPAGMQPADPGETAVAENEASVATPPALAARVDEDATKAAAAQNYDASTAGDDAFDGDDQAAEQANAIDEDGGGGLLRIVWIAAIVLALAAGGAWVAGRLRTREGMA